MPAFGREERFEGKCSIIRTIFKTTEVGGLPSAHRYGHTTC